jgi:hypothetical protein
VSPAREITGCSERVGEGGRGGESGPLEGERLRFSFFSLIVPAGSSWQSLGRSRQFVHR